MTTQKPRRRRPRKKSVGSFGRLVRAHRERLGISISDLARCADIDQGLLSKIERGLRPAPQLVPYVHRIAERFGLDSSSQEYKELCETAYRERFGERDAVRSPNRGRVREIVTY